MSQIFSDAIKGFGTVKTEIIGDFKDFIGRADKKVTEATKPAIEEVAHKILASAQELVPVKSGALKDSLEVKVAPSGKKAVVKASKDKAWYAFLVHFGTKHLPGRPFLYQAAERHSGELKGLIQENLRKDGDSK